MSYFKHLEMLQLESLKNRRLYHDILLKFKCLHGFTSASPDAFVLKLRFASTRADGLRLEHFCPRAKALSAAFLSRAPREWDELPDCGDMLNNILFQKRSQETFKCCK